jgi:glycosyltransferase involved in cell wall biosynthesis
MTASRVTLVLPAFNEAARLGGALDELFAYLATNRELADRIDVLVVDDGSTDGTSDIVTRRPEAASAAATGRTQPMLAVMRVPHAGKGAAVRAGMLAAAGELLVFADADMATPPNQLPALLAALGRADVALGSRFQPDGSDQRVSQPPLRRVLGRVFHALAAAWVSGPIRDTQCGFKGFRREVARDLFGRQQITSIVFDVELIHLALRRNYRLEVVPVRWADQRGSRMRARPGLALRVAWDLFRIPIIHRGLRRVQAPAAPAAAVQSEPESPLSE